jgi:hypothetical protein
MMTHDPFQNYQTLGAYPGGATPFGLPYSAFQSPFNPAAIAGQPVQNPGAGGYGFYPQQTHGVGNPGQQGILQQLLALNPLAGPQNPYLQHPLAQSLWQNPFLAASLQSPLLNPALAYQGWPQPQQQFHYPQAQGWPQQQQFSYPPAPQTMIGSGGFGQQPFTQINPLAQFNPLAQLALRQATGYGISPLTGCF